MAQLKGGTTIAGFKAWHYGNLRINSSGEDVTHLTPVTFTEDITIDSNAILASGQAIVSGYNSGAILRDQGNGNIELNAAGGHLYLGQFNTGVIRLSADLKTAGNTSLIATTDGILYDQGVKLTDKYAQLRRIEVTVSGGDDWFTIAEVTGRGAARFFLADENSGEHGHVEFYAGISFGNDPYINIVSYGSFTGNGNGMITGLRLLQEDADPTYGTYKLQAQFKASGSQTYTAAIFEDIIPFQQWDLLTSWTEAGTPTGWTGRINVDLTGSTTSGFITTGDMIVQGNIKENGVNLSTRYLRKDVDDTLSAITTLGTSGVVDAGDGHFKFGNVRMATSGDDNSIHFSNTGQNSISLIPQSTTIANNGDIGRASYRWKAGYFGDLNVEGDFILNTNGSSYLKAVDSVGGKRNILWLGGTDIVEMGDAALSMQFRAAGAIKHFDGTNTNDLIHSGGGQSINGELDVTGDVRVDTNIILDTNGPTSKLLGRTTTNATRNLAYIGTGDIAVFGDINLPTYVRGSSLKFEDPVGTKDIIHSGGGQTIADSLTIEGVGDTVLKVAADPDNIDEAANPSIVLAQDGDLTLAISELDQTNVFRFSVRGSGSLNEIYSISTVSPNFNFSVAPTYNSNSLIYEGRDLNTLGRLRLSSIGDVDLSSTLHALQIGLDTGENLAVDVNEIQARSNGSANALWLNSEGGNVYVNGSRVLTTAYGTATNADKLDNLDSTQFVRSDADDTITANTTWSDDSQLRMGDDGDFRIYHNGTSTYVDNNTGNLNFRNNALEGEIHLSTDDSGGSSTHMIQMGGSALNVRLFTGGAEKFRTTTAGTWTTGNAIVTGSISVGGVTPSASIDNGKAIALGDTDTGIRQNGDGVLELWTNNAARVTIDRNVSIRTELDVDVTGDVTASNDVTANSGKVNLTASASVEFDSSTNSIDFVFA